MNAAEYEITDGYVGSFGVTYERATDQSLGKAIEAGAQRNSTTTDDIMRRLADGQKIAWCDSPNYYYDHGTGYIRRKHTAKPTQLVKCSCGHSVPRVQVMNASLGTSCPECYDRMSG